LLHETGKCRTGRLLRAFRDLIFEHPTNRPAQALQIIPVDASLPFGDQAVVKSFVDGEVALSR
jgi:hypothetical protein